MAERRCVHAGCRCRCAQLQGDAQRKVLWTCTCNMHMPHAMSGAHLQVDARSMMLGREDEHTRRA